MVSHPDSSAEQGFFDHSPAVRLIVTCAFALCIFLFVHFREVRVEVLEANTVANKYLVAQTDFEFVDRDATLILKRESVREIGRIRKLSPSEISHRRLEFEERLQENAEWRERLGEKGLESVYPLLSDLQNSMKKIRFTNFRTRMKMQENKLPVSGYEILTHLDFAEPIFLPRKVWSHLFGKMIDVSQYQPEAVTLVSRIFDQERWKVEEDIPTEKLITNQIQDRVPQKVTKVNAGDRIIDRGDKVTQRHLAMLQAMKQALSDKRRLAQPPTILGSSILTCLFTFLMGSFLKAYYSKIFRSNRKLCLLVTIIVSTMAIAKGVEYFLLNSSSNLQEMVRYPLFVPLVAILVCNLLSSSLAVIISAFLSIIFSATLAFDHIGFLFVNAAASLIVVLSVRTIYRRKEIFVVCAKAWLGVVVVIIGLYLYHADFSVDLLPDVVSTWMSMVLTAFLAMGLLPLFESIFQVMTDMTLTEYMDPNNELLRRLSFEAPGTHQHSNVVGNLAQAAAVAIGANGLFCRVASLYHDVGKMLTPHYFTENQQDNMNVHQLFTPEESAQTIMAHVTEGVKMARKAGLPKRFIDVIREHHGTTRAYFFYRKQVELMGGDESKVDDAEFRYAGPKPQTRESAIIMIADTFEAAHRSLKEPTEQTLRELIDCLVWKKAEDGQFDECPLTFEELRIVKQTMVHTLVAGMHVRISYPK